MSVRQTPRERDHLNGNPPVALNGSGGHPPQLSPKAPPPPQGPPMPESLQKLVSANEQTWLVVGQLSEQMGDLERALSAYEHVLRHNAYSIPGLTQMAGIARIKENFPVAIDYFQRVLSLQPDNGEIWSALGHCYLMQDELQKAYQAYQHALYSLPNPKENPKLWYGIGILYDRYGSLDNAEEAFASVLKMDKDFDKSNEVLFRLGIIYKQQTKYSESLRCFEQILRNPPSPLANADIYFQIGHVHEQQGHFDRARDAYTRVVQENPTHAKVLQQLGWLYHQDGTSFQDQDLAIQYLTKSLEADPGDAQSWYLLGRAFMAGQKYNKAYEAYQQAVYRDGRNPTFWCSIGVLYFQINQYRDALDAYSRAIRINPYIPEVWYDLGSLYESCNNQIGDAIDAYARAAELDPNNASIANRLQVLKHSQATGAQISAAPAPQDVHPTLYANPAPPAPGPPGALLSMHTAGPRPSFRADSRGPASEMPPPSAGPAGRSPPPPFRGGPPPPVVIDDSRQMQVHPHLAPMELDAPQPPPSASREYPPPPTGARGMSILLHPDERTGPPPPHQHDSYYGPGEARGRRSSVAGSPPTRARSPTTSPYHSYGRGGPTRSPHSYSREPVSAPQRERERDHERDADWQRRDWEHRREMRAGPGPEYAPQQPPYHDARYERSPPGGSARGYPPHGGQSMPPISPREHPSMRGGEPMQIDTPSRRYENGPPPPEGYSAQRGPPPPPPSFPSRTSESPHVAHRSRRGTFSKDEPSPAEMQPPQQLAGPGGTMGVLAPEPKKRRRATTSRSKNNEPTPVPTPGPAPRSHTETPKPYPPQQQGSYRGSYKGRETPEAGSSGSNQSQKPSPRESAASAPMRVVDEDYDEGVAETLVNLATFRGNGAQPPQTPSEPPPSYSQAPPPPQMSGPGVRAPSPTPSMRSHASHRGSVSSTRSGGQGSPPVGTKRARSSERERDDSDGSSKRTKMDTPAPATSQPSTRPSPIPFRTQPMSPDERGTRPSPPQSGVGRRSPPGQGPQGRRSYPPSPPIPNVLPPVPQARPQSALPPITTLEDREDKGQEPEREREQRPPPPPSRGSMADVMNPAPPTPKKDEDKA
ncbi:TPR-like protein [Peniophora sp. CONT]|nr:TPR-like protein [Peniophora sp. CONT]